MKKVSIEITENGYKTHVQIDDTIYEEVWEATDTGTKRISGDFEKEETVSYELVEALSGFSNFDIMLALKEEV